MKTNLKNAKILRETAAKLIKQAEELEAGIDRNKCVDGEDTGERVKTGDCKTCGNPTWIICKNKKVVADRVNSNYCKNCKHFKSLKLNKINAGCNGNEADESALKTGG